MQPTSPRAPHDAPPVWPPPPFGSPPPETAAQLARMFPGDLARLRAAGHQLAWHAKIHAGIAEFEQV